jgi:hypothetical protein
MLLIRSLVVLICLPLRAFSMGYHVTVDGTSGGDGSVGRPWSLQYALSHPVAVKGGDTIWVHGGTYRSSGTLENSLFKVLLQGSPSAPIIVRNYNNERAILNGNNIPRNFILYVMPAAKYVWFLPLTRPI